MVGLSAPTDVSEIDGLIEVLKQKQDKLNIDGEKKV
jgi:hypothetical protein